MQQSTCEQPSCFIDGRHGALAEQVLPFPLYRHTQFRDERGGIACRELADKARYIRFDNPLRLGDRVLATGLSFQRQSFKVIEIIEECVVDSFNGWVDICGNSKVDDENRPSSPRATRGLYHFRIDRVPTITGSGQNDIRVGQGFRASPEIGEMHRHLARGGTGPARISVAQDDVGEASFLELSR
jgi:hypothetical protein